MSRPMVGVLAWVWLSVGLLPAQVREEWVARYDGPAHDSDIAYALAVDAEGNVYVTGSSNGFRGIDAATVKYDPKGQEVWVARYNPEGASGQYAGFALALDGKGGVYVTGQSRGQRPGFDYLTIKYDAEGRQVWVDRYYESWYSDGQARALAIDAEGSVYVTGVRRDLSLGIDSGYVTIKYDTEGQRVWVARYKGPGHGPDGAAALALDAEGNVYVTGGSKGSDGRFDYATIKYDRDGQEVWVARFNEPGNGNANAKALALDAQGNVYVTGWSAGESRYVHYATVKYDADGNELWTARYDGPGNPSGGSAQALALDSQGHVYVTGDNAGVGTGADYVTVKYDAEGQELWVARYDGPAHGLDWPSAIALDGEENVYVTGKSKGVGTNLDYATVKYDAEGNEVWVARYDGPRHEQDYPLGMAVDQSGNVYVTGGSCGLIGFSCLDYATIKYSQK